MSSTDVCPYKGLARFETSDAEFYFGREQVVAEAIGRLVGGRFLALVGASGSGKSSLLRAGLLRALGSGAIPGSDRWSYALLRPGDHPITALASANEPTVPKVIAGSESPSRTVLIVDQFEETFTACTDEAERTAFLDSITQAALSPDGANTVVLAMRADYYGRCAEHRELASLVAAHQILLGPMKPNELRHVIDLPAEHAGLTVEDRLTDALVEHTVNQPGGLPLLSTALLELWTNRRDRTLRFEDYLRTGGVEGAVARLAEDAFERLDEEGQAAAKRILLRLAGSGDGSEVVGRTASLSEFELDRDADASRALAALTGARLVTVAGATAEVAHEALLRDWPRLRTWLEDDAEGRKLHRHVTESARGWDEGGRDDGDLYRGARLTAALDWADSNDPGLNTLEREYLGASRSASEGEAVRARRANRRTRGLLAGVAGLLVLSLIVGNLALRQRDDARAAADVADARRLAAASLTEKDGIMSLLLARQAVELDDSAQTRSALLAALQREPAAIATMHADAAVPGDLTEWLQLSPDGHTIASGGARTTVDFFDAATYVPIGRVDVGVATTTGDFSPDGGTLAVAADRQIVRIDVSAMAAGPSVTSDRDIDAISFTLRGDKLLTAESNQREGFLVPRDPVTFEPSASAVPSESGPITSMNLSADGRWLVTTGFVPDGSRGHTEMWTEGDLQLVGTYKVGGNDVAVSPDGHMAAIAAAENGALSQNDPLKGHLVMLNLRTGAWQESREGRTVGSQGPSIGLTGLAFSADGRSVISTGDDHRIVIWDASKATIEEAFADPAALDMFTPVPSPDGSTVFTIDVDGNIVAWDLKGDKRLGQSFDVGSSAPWFAISPDGRTLAIQHGDMSHAGGPSSIRLFDTSTMKPTGIVIPYNRFENPALAFSPKGHVLAVCTIGGYVQLWDVRTGRPAGPPLQAHGLQEIWLWAAAFSPDGSLLATGGSAKKFTTGVVLLWDVATGQLVARLPEFDHVVGTVNFTPDGARVVATTGWDNTPGGGEAIVWNIDESRVERRIPVDDTSAGPSDISNDGTTLATAGSSGKRLWDLSTGRQVGPKFTGGQGNTVDLSPDGRTLLAAGTGQVMMWDVATGSVIGRPFQAAGQEAGLAASFAPDGRRLFVVSDTGDAFVWDVDPVSWEARACQIAGRSLSEAEWSVNLPDRPYEPTCGS